MLHVAFRYVQESRRCVNLTRSHEGIAEGGHESSSALAVLLSRFVRSLVLLHVLALLLALLLNLLAAA